MKLIDDARVDRIGYDDSQIRTEDSDVTMALDEATQRRCVLERYRYADVISLYRLGQLMGDASTNERGRFSQALKAAIEDGELALDPRDGTLQRSAQGVRRGVAGWVHLDLRRENVCAWLSREDVRAWLAGLSGFNQAAHEWAFWSEHERA